MKKIIKLKLNLYKSRYSSVITMAVSRLHVNVSSGATAVLSGDLHRLNLCQLCSFCIKVAFSETMSVAAYPVAVLQ
ncbi:hypothetical protein HanRHA438_Chr11g0486571 [Helianthus annuus]|nr:hypothetical protein HanRHA438_Chr11g0486571 [Helianthus annuus]